MATKNRQYDILVFGATGFTGKHIAQELVQCKFDGSWAIAGRDRTRLEQVVRQLSIPAGSPAPGVVVADVTDQASLTSAAATSRVLLNAVGPFRQFGPPVIKACIDAGTHYLDVSGEPEFMERAALEFDTAAASAGVLVASAMGFDSVPGDIGAQQTAALFAPHERCTWVESFVTLRTGPAGFGGNYATYESAVLGYASLASLAALRKQVIAARGRPRLDIPGPRPPRAKAFAWDARLGRWTLPFPGSDASVMRRTWTALAAKGVPPAHTSVGFTLPGTWALVQFVLFGMVFALLAKLRWGRAALLRWPRLFSGGVFSRQGPTPTQIASTSFEYLHIGHGYGSAAAAAAGGPPDTHRCLRIRGPEPGYMACSIFITQAARVVLQERDAIQSPGGVLTPGELLHGTTYVDRLRARGIAFDVIPPPA